MYWCDGSREQVVPVVWWMPACGPTFCGVDEVGEVVGQAEGRVLLRQPRQLQGGRGDVARHAARQAVLLPVGIGRDMQQQRGQIV